MCSHKSISRYSVFQLISSSPEVEPEHGSPFSAGTAHKTAWLSANQLSTLPASMAAVAETPETLTETGQPRMFK